MAYSPEIDKAYRFNNAIETKFVDNVFLIYRFMCNLKKILQFV